MTLVVVPLIVYAISAFFALILWGIGRWPGDGMSAAQRDGHCRRVLILRVVDLPGRNLVGVRLTDVGDQLSDHKLVQVVDIVVSTWSLALTGGVVGLVGLTLMPLMSSKPEPLPSNVTADGGADGIAAGGSGAIASEDERLRETINAAVEAAVEAKLKQMLPELTTALSAAVTKHRHERREHTRSRHCRTQPQGPETIESERSKDKWRQLVQQQDCLHKVCLLTAGNLRVIDLLLSHVRGKWQHLVQHQIDCTRVYLLTAGQF